MEPVPRSKSQGTACANTVVEEAAAAATNAAAVVTAAAANLVVVVVAAAAAASSVAGSPDRGRPHPASHDDDPVLGLGLRGSSSGW